MTELKDDAIPPEFIGRRGYLRPVPKEIFATTADPAGMTPGEMAGILLVPALAVLLAYLVAGFLIAA